MEINLMNSHCIDNRCINYFENMCMQALLDDKKDVKPRLELEDAQAECKEFKRGSYLLYVVDQEDIKEDLADEAKWN